MKITEIISESKPSKELTKPRNFVAKNAINTGAGHHKDKKRAEKQGDVKHKKQAVPIDEQRYEFQRIKFRGTDHDIGEERYAFAIGDNPMVFNFSSDEDNPDPDSPSFEEILAKVQRDGAVEHFRITPVEQRLMAKKIAGERRKYLNQRRNDGQPGISEAEKKGLYYNVNKRKKAGTSRDASSPKAPTAQAWKDAAKTAKKESVDEADELRARGGLAAVNKKPRPGQTDYRNIPVGNHPDASINKFTDKDREEQPSRLKAKIKSTLGKHTRPNLPEQGVAEGSGDRRDAYQRDYDSSVSGMGNRDSYAYSQDGGGNDERHDLDPTDWYVVQDGKMMRVSVYPHQVDQARAKGYSPSREQARDKAQESVAEGQGTNQRQDRAFDPELDRQYTTVYRIADRLNKKGVKYPEKNEEEIIKMIGDEMPDWGYNRKEIRFILNNDPHFVKGVFDALRKIEVERRKGVAEGKRRMSRAAKGYEKYGKAGMTALAKAGREGASEEKLDKIRDRHDKYDNNRVKEDGSGGATAGSTSAANVGVGAVYKNKLAKQAKNQDGTAKNALDINANLLTGGSIKR